MRNVQTAHNAPKPDDPCATNWSARLGNGIALAQTVGRYVFRIPAELLVGLVRLYQIFLSPFFGGQCRFYPSCSEYFIQAVRKYGAVRGAFKGVWRILRCHPFHRGGYDPP